MRVIGKEKEINSTGGMWYTAPPTGPSGAADTTAWAGAPSTVQATSARTTVVSVETLVYSLKQDKLVWAGRSETTNPSRVDTFVKELANLTVAAHEEGGLAHESREIAAFSCPRTRFPGRARGLPGLERRPC